MTRTEHSRRKRRILLWLLIAAAVIAVGVLWFRWQQRAIESTVTQVELSALPEEFDGYTLMACEMGYDDDNNLIKPMYLYRRNAE